MALILSLVCSVARVGRPATSPEPPPAVKAPKIAHAAKSAKSAKSSDGASCAVSAAIAAHAKPNGKGRAINVKPGAVALVKAVGDEFQLRVGKFVSYAPAAAVSAACPALAIAAPAPPEVAVGIPAPPVIVTTPAPAPPTVAAMQAPAPKIPADAAHADPPLAHAEPPMVHVDSPAAKKKSRDNSKMAVAVMDLSGSSNVPAEFLKTLTALVPSTLDDLGPFRTISSEDIRQMMNLEETKQVVGCSSNTSCIAELGNALGAERLVTGSLSLIGDTYLVQLQLTNSKVARVENRVSREYHGNLQGLLEEMRTSTKLLVRDLLAAKSGQLLVRASEEGASIRVDGTIIGASPLPAQTIAGGVHTVTVDKEGFIRFARDVEVSEGQRAELDAQLLPSPEFQRAYEQKARRERTIGYVLIGVGVASVVGGVATLVVSMAQAKQLNKDVTAYNAAGATSPSQFASLNSRRQAIGTLDVVTLVLGGVGVAAIASGVAVLVTSDNPNKYNTSVKVGALELHDVGLGPLGLTLSGSF